MRLALSGRVASTRTNSILYNGGFEVAPAYTADTNVGNRWIDGTAAGAAVKTGYGWGAPASGSGLGANASAAFDTAQFRSGAVSLRISNLNASGAGVIATYRLDITSSASTLSQLFFLQPSTSYTLTGYARTNNVATNAVFMDLRQYGSTGTVLTTTSTNKLSGTDLTWRQLTLTVTTSASAVFGAIFLRNNVSGNTSDVWFDDISLVPATTGRVVGSGRVAA